MILGVQNKMSSTPSSAPAPSVADATQVVFALARINSSGVNLLGTAFALGDSLLATTFHATNGDDRDLVVLPPRYTGIDQYQDTADSMVKTLPVAIKNCDPFRDLCTLRLRTTSLVGGVVLGTTDDVRPGDECISYGFPHADTGRLVLTQHRATVGARILIANGPIKSKHLVLNIQARPGQSGGPVIRDGIVIALIVGGYAPQGGAGQLVVSGIDPVTLHQTTHAVSAEYLKAILDE